MGLRVVGVGWIDRLRQKSHHARIDVAVRVGDHDRVGRGVAIGIESRIPIPTPAPRRVFATSGVPATPTIVTVTVAVRPNRCRGRRLVFDSDADPDADVCAFIVRGCSHSHDG